MSTPPNPASPAPSAGAPAPPLPRARAALRRFAFALAGALLAFAGEQALVTIAHRHDLAMAVLASGGRLSASELALAGSLLLARLFVVLVVPPLLVQSAAMCLFDLVRARPAAVDERGR